MKTIRQHILTLKPEHRIAAFKNIGMNKVLEETCESPSSALNHAMNWTKTPEGSRYWTKIWDDLGAGTYFDAPQYTAEDFEAKAKEILHTAPPTKPNFGTERPATEEELEGLDQLTGRLPTDAAERKGIPVYSGFIKYFPLAIAEVAKLSRKGNDQHNPGMPLHWDRSKSGDEKDAMCRHIIDEDWVNVAWRALANLQKELEK
jgi:hypothetical protein